MRKEYNFKGSKKNPYAKLLKKQITIRIDADIIEYFKSLASEMGISYQILINLYLSKCAKEEKRPEINWL